MAVSLEELEDAYAVAVRFVRKRDDGRRYVPIMLRLEHEISSRRTRDHAYERIIGMAANKG